jgi:hypothetical protein
MMQPESEDVGADALAEKVRVLTEEKQRITANYETFQEEVDLQLQQLEGEARALVTAKPRAHARIQRRVVEINQQLKKLQEKPPKQGNGNS